MSAENGTLIESEKYRVLQELGRGGMGVVYLAEDRQLRRRVALKVLYDYLNRDQAFVERFQEEACSVSTLHHPNIVCVHGLERAGEVVAIDMEFVEGPSLDRVAAITPHIAAAIARDVLGGLAACHRIGVVHRDIKPSNILVNEAGQAKITDFGLAKAYASHVETSLGGNTSSGFYMGTPRYMPIQAWEGGGPEPCWDLYSFGVVLHELISGRTAFPGANPIEVMRKQLTEVLPPLDILDRNVSPEFSGLVEFLLSGGRAGAGEIAAPDAIDRLRQTPEYQALNERDGVTTVALPPAALKRRKAGRVRFLWRRPATVVGLAALAAFAIYGGVHFASDRPGGAASPSAEVPEAKAAPVTKGPGWQFFDVSAINSDQPITATWMVETDGAGQPIRVIALSALDLWVFTVGTEGTGNRKVFHGFWGGGVSGANRTGHYGTVDGFLLWDSEEGRIAAHASRVRSRDNTTAAFSFAGQLKRESYDRGTFIRELESNSLVQGILYRELLARALPWAAEVEAMMPALPNGRAIVPFVFEDVTPDGVLGETLWIEPIYNDSGRIGEIAAVFPKGGPTLLARWGESGLHLALVAVGCGPEPRFEIGLLPAPDVSAMESGRFFAGLSDSEPITSRYLESGRERPWACDWQGGILSNAEGTRMELKIPFTSLKDDAAPRKGKRWRLNARLTSVGGDGARATHAAWGAAEFEELEHGTLLIYDR